MRKERFVITDRSWAIIEPLLPRERPMPCTDSPFCASRRPMRLDDGGIDKQQTIFAP